MDHETYIQKHCRCGIDSAGQWSEKLFDEFGCNCRDTLPKYGYVFIDGELVEIEE